MTERLDDEDMISRLLRLGGIRAEIPPDRQDRVKRAVMDECRAVSRQRASRRRTVIVGAVLAAAAAAVVAVRIGLPSEAGPPLGAVVATVERLDGSGGRLSNNAASDGFTVIRLANTIRAGDRLETDASGRVGLRLTEGLSVRLDHGSTARLLSASAIELREGAVYVDSGAGSPRLTIHTSFGIVSDIGTQFEVRLGAATLRVRVRSGVVQVQRGPAVSSAGAGTELTLSRAGAASRGFEPYGPEWAWAATLGPVFKIEGRPLSAFLEHLCREHGWRLAYADAKLGLEASGITMHGSIEGLQPSDALAIVLATTGFTHRLKDGELLVARTNQR